jgi:hypothetical protein
MPPDLQFFLEPRDDLGQKRYAALKRILYDWVKLNKGVSFCCCMYLFLLVRPPLLLLFPGIILGNAGQFWQSLHVQSLYIVPFLFVLPMPYALRILDPVRPRHNKIVGMLYFDLVHNSNEDWSNEAKANTYFLLNALMAKMHDVFVPDLDEANTGIHSRNSNMIMLLSLHNPKVRCHLDNGGSIPVSTL